MVVKINKEGKLDFDRETISQLAKYGSVIGGGTVATGVFVAGSSPLMAAAAGGATMVVINQNGDAVAEVMDGQEHYERTQHEKPVIGQRSSDLPNPSALHGSTDSSQFLSQSQQREEVAGYRAPSDYAGGDVGKMDPSGRTELFEESAPGASLDPIEKINQDLIKAGLLVVNEIDPASHANPEIQGCVTQRSSRQQYYSGWTLGGR